MVPLIFALISQDNIVVPFLASEGLVLDTVHKTAHVDYQFDFSAQGQFEVHQVSQQQFHPLLETLRQDLTSPGLILFTSGSSGVAKASVHNFAKLVEQKLASKGKPLSTLVFLMFDHIGGINTLLHVLIHGGKAVFLTDRSAQAICQAVQEHQIQLLPTTPTFLNMLLISGLYQQYDLSSLKLVTYGTEPMTQSTLQAMHQALPHLTLKQTYGLTEVGILSTKSLSDESLWVKVGGEHYQTKIIDNILWIKTDMAMLGYLNAPSPFDSDGWFNTGDRVEVKDDHVRILGRESEIINVGGEKVYPAEVENVILQVDNVRDVLVSRKTSAVTGQVPVARVQLINAENKAQAQARIRQYCQQHLSPFMIPAVIGIVEADLHGQRFKKLRNQS